MVAGFVILAAFPGTSPPPARRPGRAPLPRPGGEPRPPVLVTRIDAGSCTLDDLADTDERPVVAVVRGEPTASALRQEAAGARAAGRSVPAAASSGSTPSTTPSPPSPPETWRRRSSAPPSSTRPPPPSPTSSPEPTSAARPPPPEASSSGRTRSARTSSSRLIHGTRVALLIGFASALVALVVGVPLGLLAGYRGGPLDRLLTVLMDSLYAFPGLILAIAITAVLGPSILNVIVAIAVLYIPTYYRIVRGQTLTVKEELYVEAARSFGATSGEMLRRYVFPNVIPSVAVIFSVNVADAILTGRGSASSGSASLRTPPTGGSTSPAARSSSSRRGGSSPSPDSPSSSSSSPSR